MVAFDTISSQKMKDANALAVFNVIRNNEGIPRVKIADITNLSRSTVTLIVDDFLSKGVVIEKTYDNSTSSRGRRPVGLFLNTEKYFVITLNISYEYIYGAIYDIGMHKLFSEQVVFADIGRNFTDNVLYMIRYLMNWHTTDNPSYIGIGIGIHGLVERTRDSLVTSTKIGVFAKDILHPIEEAFGLPVYIDNIANFAGIMEKRLYHEDVKNLAYFYIGRGIGTCIIANNCSLSGSHGSVPEIGHMSIDRNGIKCSCGNYGCLEQYLSINSLLSEAKRRMEDKVPSVISDILDGDLTKLNIHVLWQAADQQDEMAIDIIRNAARCLGVALVNIINIFDPEIIIIGGSISDLGDFFLDGVRQIVLKQAISPFRNHVRIQYASSPEPLITEGAAMTVLDNQVPSLASR